jgi:hypothetical protein
LIHLLEGNAVKGCQFWRGLNVNSASYNREAEVGGRKVVNPSSTTQKWNGRLLTMGGTDLQEIGEDQEGIEG